MSGKNVKLIDNFDLIGNQKVIDLNSVGLPSERNRINTPVVAICGLAPMTQKFDLQLYFRNHFLRNGYKVSQIGTKLNRQLFGFHTWGEALYDNRFTEVEKIARINQLIRDTEVRGKAGCVYCWHSRCNSALYSKTHISIWNTRF